MEVVMIRLYVRHSVSDFAKWKKRYEEFDKERKNYDVVAHGVFQAVNDPKDVTVYHDFKTLESAQSLAKSEALRKAMNESGVVGTPTVWITKAA
jgi:hypothetical protein